MRIAVLGCGAMGMLIGGYLSKNNDVYLIDIDKEKVDSVNANGIMIDENDGSTTHVFPKATTDSTEISEVDLVVIFVKAMFSENALKNNQALIGKNTYLLTLQNGAGHEELLKQFVSHEKIIMGVTNHNSSINKANHIKHGGSGKSYIGLPFGTQDTLSEIANNFTACGIETEIQENIRKIVWGKLFVNASLSALTGALQVPIGYFAQNSFAKEMMETLVTEAVAVANAEGMDFDEAEIQLQVMQVVEGAPKGLTSIYADIRDGRKTEVDTISGAVVKASDKVGILAPSHKFLVNMIHALEGKNNL